MDRMEIAKTIMGQIKATDPMAMFAWGCTKYVALGEEKLSNGGYQVGGLQFNVMGAKFKGKVLVRLTAKDLYDVEIGRVYKHEWKQKAYVEDIFCEELMETIDRLVER